MSISVKNFNFDELFYYEIPAGYKNMTNCFIKITFFRGAFLCIFERGLE